MKIIEKIRKKFYDKEYEFAIPHFFEEMADDELEFSDIERVIKTGKIRNKFTHDPRGTRYEIVGCSHDEREVAVICRIKTTAILILRIARLRLRLRLRKTTGTFRIFP